MKLKIRGKTSKGAIQLTVQHALEVRLQKHAATNWKDQCRGVIVRFRGAFAYVDAFRAENFYMPGTTPEQRAEIDATPTHLCRLRYLGSADRWEYAFFKYSDEKYEPSFGMSGSFVVTPEEAFDTSALAYLQG